MSRAREGLRTLFPGYFALVMATGIVSIASSLLGHDLLARILLGANVVFYVTLWVLSIIRMAMHPGPFGADLSDHARGPGFFTVVAGTCVLGSQLEQVAGMSGVALVLWVFGFLLWAAVMYGFLAAVMVRGSKPALEATMHGGWLVAVVATQTLAVLGSLLAPHYPGSRELILFCSLILFLAGGLLYIVIITLVFQRLVFGGLAPEGLSPVFWVTMGAAAVSTLSGARLMLDASQWVFLETLLPFLKGFTLLYWAIASWWIPLLLVLGAWRHLGRRFPLRYDPAYWSLVFPLGMYTASTFVLSRAEGLSFLSGISRVFIWIALGAWSLAFVGMALRLAGTLFGRPGTPPGR
jgi:tellurite resistance protein TehA-like permease